LSVVVRQTVAQQVPLKSTTVFAASLKRCNQHHRLDDQINHFRNLNDQTVFLQKKPLCLGDRAA
jgi:hypothetical protein